MLYGFSNILAERYKNDRILYAVVCLGIMVLAGLLVGLVMDCFGRLLGLDTSALRHRREKVEL